MIDSLRYLKEEIIDWAKMVGMLYLMMVVYMIEEKDEMPEWITSLGGRK